MGKKQVSAPLPSLPTNMGQFRPWDRALSLLIPHLSLVTNCTWVTAEKLSCMYARELSRRLAMLWSAANLWQGDSGDLRTDVCPWPVDAESVGLVQLRLQEVRALGHHVRQLDHVRTDITIIIIIIITRCSTWQECPAHCPCRWRYCRCRWTQLQLLVIHRKALHRSSWRPHPRPPAWSAWSPAARASVCAAAGGHGAAHSPRPGPKHRHHYSWERTLQKSLKLVIRDGRIAIG